MVKKNSCIFISGTGSNLKALIKNSREYNFPINISYIISSSAKAKGLVYATLYKIPYKVVNLNCNKSFELLLNELKKRKISLICLAGYMKILNKKFINRFNKKIINIHPSLLPKYKGLNTFKRTLESKEKQTGCTVHYVNNKLDSGKIIIQKSVSINSNDNVKTLKNKIQKKEYRAYSEAVIKVFN